MMASKVLVVDDAQYVRGLLKDILKSAGYEVVEAENGKEALFKYAATKPDLVTLDIMMPDINGIDTLKAIKCLDPNASVVMVTSLEQRSKIQSAMLEGAKGFISKPFNKADILGMIKKILGNEPFSHKMERIRIVFAKAMRDGAMAMQEILHSNVDVNIKNVTIVNRSDLVKIEPGDEKFIVTVGLDGESEGRIVIPLELSVARNLATILQTTPLQSIEVPQEDTLKELFQIVGGKVVCVLENFKQRTNLGSVNLYDANSASTASVFSPPKNVENVAICEASICIQSMGVCLDIFLWMDADKLSALLG